MKNKQDYIQDIADIRSIMERSSKFLSLSGLAGIMAGLYAIAGAWIAFSIYGFYPDTIFYTSPNMPQVALVAVGVLILALLSAILDSRRKARKRDETIWNATSRRLLATLTVPLCTGGVLIMIVISMGLIGLVAPLMLLFYGLALYHAGHFTIPEVKLMGVVQIVLGLVGSWFIEYGLLFWVLGFGVVHILYGIYVHFRYER